MPQTLILHELQPICLVNHGYYTKALAGHIIWSLMSIFSEQNNKKKNIRRERERKREGGRECACLCVLLLMISTIHDP